MKIGMIFPGQGSQFVGMAKQFYDDERIVQEYFDQASHCLDKNFVKLCFASSEKELMETVNTQTAVFLVSASVTALLKEKFGIVPNITAGHSLGEYSALFAAGGINFADGLYLLGKRALFMEEACSAQNGGMLAVINFPHEHLAPIVQKYDQPVGMDAVAEIVNFNSPTQLVVSGTIPELEKIKADVNAAGGKAIMLKVAGAFHSRLMAEAEKRFSVYLEKADFHDLKVPLVSNADARLITDAADVKTALVKQISQPVLWWHSMSNFQDCDVIVEIAPGTKFAKMLSRHYPDKKIVSINEQGDINALQSDLGVAVEQVQKQKPQGEQGA